MRKRIFLVVTFILMILSISVYAKRAVLIDFSLLKANGNGMEADKSLGADDPKYKDYKDHDRVNRKQHMPTLLDYSAVAGSNFTQDEIKGMSTSLAAYNWGVVLNSSAAHVINKQFSYALEWHTRSVPVLADTGEPQPAATPAAGTTPAAAQPAAAGNVEGYTILGARVHFPETPYNCWAVIEPPFKIPAYEDRDVDFKGVKLPAEEKAKPENKGTKYEKGYGVIKNVGNIKSIDLRVFGNQFKNSIAVLIRDDNNVVSEYIFPDYLDFDGWRKITWNNPSYISEARNRELFVVPLYPRSTPFVKLEGFRIYRQGDQAGGDFVVYIKDVYVTYDEAILERENVPIDHESAWRILEGKTIEAKNRELRNVGGSQILRFLEEKKMHKETSSQ